MVEEKDQEVKAFPGNAGGFLTLDGQCRLVHVNQMAKELLNIDYQNDLFGKKLSQFFSQDSIFYNKIVNATLDQTPLHFGFLNKGQRLEVDVFPCKNENVVYLRKITRQKIVQKRHAINSILERISDGFYALDLEWRFSYLNKKALRLWRQKKEDLIGKVFWSVFPETVGSDLEKLFRKALTEQKKVNVKRRGNHTGYWYDYHIYPSQDGISVFFRNITTDKLIQEKLRQSEERFVKAFEASPAAMIISSANSKQVIEVNKAFLKNTGYLRDEIIGYNIEKLALPVEQDDDLVAVSCQAGSEGHYTNLPVNFPRKSGGMGVGLYSSEIIQIDGEECILSIINDITEIRKYQDEMARLDRLNLVGEMAASFGHEIRNPLTTVRGFIQLFGENNQNQEFKELYDLVMEEIDRCNLIIKEFISLSKNKALDLQLCNLNSIIKAVEPLTAADAAFSDIRVILNLRKIPDLMLDPNEIRQLVLNLVRNGLESMSAGQSLEIKTYLENNDVVLVVQDQGPGIDTTIIDKIGRPFVTSKENGIGLGLAVCYSIAARHGAAVSFKTDSSGTIFFVHFPITKLTNVESIKLDGA